MFGERLYSDQYNVRDILEDLEGKARTKVEACFDQWQTSLGDLDSAAKRRASIIDFQKKLEEVLYTVCADAKMAMGVDPTVANLFLSTHEEGTSVFELDKCEITTVEWRDDEDHCYLLTLNGSKTSLAYAMYRRYLHEQDPRKPVAELFVTDLSVLAIPPEMWPGLAGELQITSEANRTGLLRVGTKARKMFRVAEEDLVKRLTGCPRSQHVGFMWQLRTAVVKHVTGAEKQLQPGKTLAKLPLSELVLKNNAISKDMTTAYATFMAALYGKNQILVCSSSTVLEDIQHAHESQGVSLECVGSSDSSLAGLAIQHVFHFDCVG